MLMSTSCMSEADGMEVIALSYFQLKYCLWDKTSAPGTRAHGGKEAFVLNYLHLVGVWGKDLPRPSLPLPGGAAVGVTAQAGCVCSVLWESLCCER